LVFFDGIFDGDELCAENARGCRARPGGLMSLDTALDFSGDSTELNSVVNQVVIGRR
jgi:hypothetical protein